MPRHPADVDLTWDEVRDALRALEGFRVAVRVVERSDPEVLLAAFNGTVGALDTTRQRTLFWPVLLAGGQRSIAAQDGDIPSERDHDHAERVGFYLRRDRFHGGAGRAGGTVLAIIQGPVLLNIRRKG